MIIAGLLTMEPALLNAKMNITWCFSVPSYAECRDKYTQLFVTADLKKFLEYRDKKVLVDFFWNIRKVRRGKALLC